MRFRISAAMAAIINTLTVSSALGQGIANGEDVFKKCRVCHDVGPEAKNKIGPILHGVFGRRAGTAADFKYSDAMVDAGAKGLEWTEDTVGKYLENPRSFVPGNKMAFVGVKDEADRRDVIVYLRSVNP